MKEPLLKDAAFLEDIPKTLALPHDTLHIWWLGQSGFLIRWHWSHALLDPYLSDSLTEKYDQTDKPHVRVTKRVVSPAELGFVSVITSSHNHTDHLDSQTLGEFTGLGRRPKLIIPEANRAFVAERLKIDAELPIGLNEGECAEVGPFRFTGVPAAHNQIERDEQGRCKFLGYIVQIAGRCTIYHSGDTLWYDGMVEKLRPWNIDVALMPINGDRPERCVAGNLNGSEAARLAKDIGAKIVIPCHYDMFEFNTADPADEFIPECERIGQKYCVLQQGERWSSDELK